MADRQPNPYRPGFNQPPVVFAGRSDVLDGAAEALEIAAYDGRTPRPLILLGPRGVGKTVTLGEIAELAAERHSWPAVHVEVKVGGRMLVELGSRLRDAAQLLAGTEPREPRRRPRVTGGKVEAHAFGIGGEVQLEAAADARSDDGLDAVLRTTMAAAVDAGAGLVITVDEVHNAAPEELALLCGTFQEHVPQGWPVVLALAALPTLRNNRGRRRLPTYLERAEWHDLDTLPPTEAREALVGPAQQAGRPMTPDAADLLLGHAGGYPYALQVAGHFAWRASHGSRSIGVDHARQAVPRIEADLAHLFRSRWDDASPREQEYLQAMAAVAARGEVPKGGAVAAELGVPVTSVSYLRARLLRKGTIYREAGGALHFITPGMGRWILDQDRQD
ncbi:ATP-binding protein [Nocardioides sp. TF02-7]|uniref:ATP-binding protein n=1 Tax=Nocardioides sp. TF02-7 TaxID=2917724 RepID=UPI001F066674|nr:ATP-binding protein [Nocardioides sp. TF02-7]UMG92437.1 ATP-binding protein [Nocardioides sp. TF02-7]